MDQQYDPRNVLTSHLGRDVCGELLMHAGLMLLLCRRRLPGGAYGKIVLWRSASLFFHHGGFQSSVGTLDWMFVYMFVYSPKLTVSRPTGLLNGEFLQNEMDVR